MYDAYMHGDILDIGAFEGWYSALLAPKAKRATLVSCEPDRSAYNELLTTLAMLGRVFPGPTFVALPVPVGDGNPVSVSRPPGGHPRYAPEAGDGTPAPTVDRIVDDLGLKPGLIKIDVEGAEPFVLRGMQETLRVHRPVVMLELHPRWLPEGTGAADVEAVLADHGYTSRRISSEELASRSLWTP